MNAEEFYKKTSPELWNSDLPQEDEGFYGKDDMIKFAEQYHQSKLREELIEFADFIDDKVLEMVKVQRPVELVDEYLKQKEQ